MFSSAFVIFKHALNTIYSLQDESSKREKNYRHRIRGRKRNHNVNDDKDAASTIFARTFLPSRFWGRNIQPTRKLLGARTRNVGFEKIPTVAVIVKEKTIP